jgi:hypothetical protein
MKPMRAARSTWADDARKIRQEYLKTAPSFAERLYSGDYFGLSIRPDITSDRSSKFIEDAEWTLFDAWVDVGHALSFSVREYGIANGLRPNADEAPMIAKNNKEGMN